MYVNKCTKCGAEFETKNPKRVICPSCLYPDRKPIITPDDVKPAGEQPTDVQDQQGSTVNPENQQQSEFRKPYPNNYSSHGGYQGGGQGGYQNRGGYQGGGQGGYQNRGGYQGGGQGGYQNQGGYQGGGQGGYQQRDGAQGGYNQGGYQNRGGYQGGGQGGYQNQGGYQQRDGAQGGYNQGGFRRPYQGGGQGGGFNGPRPGGFGGSRPGGFGGPRPGGFNNRRPQKSLLISKEQVAQIEVLYKRSLPLPNPDIHEVIGKEIELEATKVFFGINLVRQKFYLPKLPYPKRKLAVSPEQLMAIKNLYEPLLPLPPIGCHKIIASQLKMDEWRVHVGIGLVRKQMNLPRWNAERDDVPEALKNKQQAT